MSTRVNLGRVSLVPRGTWTSETTYQKLDLVNYENDCYISTTTVAENVDISNTDYWYLLVKGNSGNANLSMIADEFSLSTSYSTNDYVVYDNKLYKFTQTHSAGTWNSSDVTETDLTSELRLKTNTTNLGDLAYEDDAPSDDKEYVRKNGDWAEASSGGNVSEWGDLTGDIEDQEDLQNELDEKAKIVITEKSGSVVSIKDAAAYPVEELKIGIEPVQDLHGYDSPWPAGGSANMFDLSSYTEGSPSSTATGAGTKRTFTVGTYVKGLSIGNNWASAGNVVDVTISQNGSVTINSFNSGYGMAFIVPTLTIGSTYTFSVTKGTGGCRIGVMFYAEDGTFISGNNVANKNYYTFTVPADTVFSLLWVRPESSNTDSVFSDVMLESGETTTPSFVPYSNICPISGWTGANVTRTKNIIQNINNTTRTINGVTFTINSDKSITLSGTATSDAFYNLDFVNNFSNAVCDISKFRGMQMCISLVSTAISGVEINFKYFYSNGSMDTPTGLPSSITTYASFVVPSNAVKSRIYIKIASGTNFTTPVTVYPMLEVDNAPTVYQQTFAPITIPFPTSEIASDGVYYGGNLNVKTGEMTVDRVLYRLPEVNVNLTVQSAYIKSDAVCGLWTLDPNPYPLYNATNQKFDVYCNRLKFVKQNVWNTVGYPNCIAIQQKYLYINIANDLVGISDYTQETYQTAKEKLISYLNGLRNNGEYIDVCYKVEPQTIQLTAQQMSTLLGDNVLWSDTGAVSVNYRADTKKYIKEKVGEVKQTIFSLIANTESSMKATKNYSSGDYVIVSNELYKFTTNVANGTNLTLNSNVQKTTIAEVLIALANA